MKRVLYKIFISTMLLLLGKYNLIYASSITLFDVSEADTSLVSIIKEYYPNDSVEIFISQNEFSQEDTLPLLGVDKLIIPYNCRVAFIDLHPGENWGHECEYLFVSNDEQQISIVQKNMPPLYLLEMFALYQQGEYGQGDIILPMYNLINRNKMHRQQQESSIHDKYAVIISGGRDIYNNYYRYWNDCSAVYQTLIINGYLRNNIYVAISDGTNSANDARWGVYERSSPLDLDGNGTNDTRYAAYYNNIQLIFDSLAYKMTDNDDLFIFVGGTGDTISNHSRIALWGDGYLIDTAFVRMLRPIEARSINIVMTQSYSGGFIDEMREMENVVITTACDSNEVSYAKDGYYEEFIYNWLAGINGYAPSLMYPFYTPQFIADFADDDNDGYVSMEEAYNYASIHDRGDEHPQQESHPACLAKALIISEVVQSICSGNQFIYGSDLYIKDNPKDRGDEPNTTTDWFWESNDIWFEENGNRVNTLQSGETYDVCVRIRNRGNDIFTGDATLYIHWAKSFLGGSWPYSWTDAVSYDCEGTYLQVGDLLGSESLPYIDPGASYVARIPWTIPSSTAYTFCLDLLGANLSSLWQYCILARIVDEDEQPDASTDMSLHDFVLYHNNVAARNITLLELQNDGITDPYLTGFVGILSPNYGEDCGPYSLICNVWGGNYWDQNTIVRLTFTESFYEDQTHLKWYDCTDENGIDYSFDLSSYSYFDSIYFYQGGVGFYPIRLDVIYQDSYDPGEYPEVTVSLELIDANGGHVGGTIFKFWNEHPELANILEQMPLPAPRRVEKNQIDVFEELLLVDVYNMQGMYVTRCSYKDIKSLKLPNGVYVIRMQNENQSYQMKVVK